MASCCFPFLPRLTVYEVFLPFRGQGTAVHGIPMVLRRDVTSSRRTVKGRDIVGAVLDKVRIILSSWQ